MKKLFLSFIVIGAFSVTSCGDATEDATPKAAVETATEEVATEETVEVEEAPVADSTVAE